MLHAYRRYRCRRAGGFIAVSIIVGGYISRSDADWFLVIRYDLLSRDAFIWRLRFPAGSDARVPLAAIRFFWAVFRH